MQDDLITTKGICLANTSYLRDCFKTNKVPVHLETGVTEIRADSVTVKHKDSTLITQLLKCSLVSPGFGSYE